MHTCLNCNHTYEGNYCPNCGQKAATHPINWSFLGKDLLHYLHYDSGLPYTLRQLVTRPGQSIREFIGGKRVKHYKPLTLILLLGGLYGLLLYSSRIRPTNLLSQMVYTLNDLIYADEFKFPTWLVENFALIEVLLFLPLFTIASYLAFYRSGFNFVEHLVLNAYLSGQRLLIAILGFPLLYILRESSAMPWFEGLINFIEIAFTFWAYLAFFKEYKSYQTFLLFLWTLVLMFVQLILIEFIWSFFI